MRFIYFTFLHIAHTVFIVAYWWLQSRAETIYCWYRCVACSVWYYICSGFIAASGVFAGACCPNRSISRWTPHHSFCLSICATTISAGRVFQTFYNVHARGARQIWDDNNCQCDTCDYFCFHCFTPCCFSYEKTTKLFGGQEADNNFVNCVLIQYIRNPPDRLVQEYIFRRNKKCACAHSELIPTHETGYQTPSWQHTMTLLL